MAQPKGRTASYTAMLIQNSIVIEPLGSHFGSPRGPRGDPATPKEPPEAPSGVLGVLLRCSRGALELSL